MFEFRYIFRILLFFYYSIAVSIEKQSRITLDTFDNTCIYINSIFSTKSQLAGALMTVIKRNVDNIVAIVGKRAITF